MWISYPVRAMTNFFVAFMLTSFLSPGTLKLLPIAHVDHMSAEKLGSAALAEEVAIAGSTSRVVKFTGIVNMGRTITILMRGSNR